jgi:glyoxylase-like metal-dependent hydrolase (beta-lactamase superfamily II)
MADRRKIVPGYVEGEFFVDITCINCGNCGDLASETFGHCGSFAGVKRQPKTDEEVLRAMQALICCPTDSIGTVSHRDVTPALSSLPMRIAENVYYLGFNSPMAAGAKSYFIESKDGNWMIDSPKLTPRLLEWLDSKGGLKYVFLTHRDNVADAARYAAVFCAERIIHLADLEAQPDSEIVLYGIDEVEQEPGFTIIPTPGHTEGHCMLLYQNKYLFSGDVLTSKQRFKEELEVWAPDHCWWSWQEQMKSLERLHKHTFEWMLPANGRGIHANSQGMSQHMAKLLERCRQESEIDPCTPERIALFERNAKHAAEDGQPIYSAKLLARAEEMKKRAGLVPSL